MRNETYEDTGLAALAHILGLLTGFLGPLLIYLLRSEEDLARDQAREVINFQLTVILASIASALLFVVGVGILLLPMVLLGDLIFSLVGALAAHRGEYYRYPVCLRLLAPLPGSSPDR